MTANDHGWVEGKKQRRVVTPSEGARGEISGRYQLKCLVRSSDRGGGVKHKSAHKNNL